MTGLESLELEETIVGLILADYHLLDRLLLSEKNFTNPKLIKLLSAMKDEYKKFHKFDLVGLVSEHQELFQGKDAITIEYLTNIMQLGLPSHFEYYQENLFRMHIKKLLLLAIERFKANQMTQDELLDYIHEIEQKSLNSKLNRLTKEQIYSLVSQKKNRIVFRFEKLTKAANIQEHDLIVIAARPGIGKTGFALNILENLSDNYNCLYFNMEMTEQQIYRRLIGINTYLEVNKLDDFSDQYVVNKAKDACNNLSKKKINIITGGQTIRTIKSQVIKESNNEHTIVFIDYVGLIRDTEKNRSSYERVTEIVKELRQISLDYNCTIFVLAQINRNSEKEKDKYPKISDLKESGELEQSATTVLMLHNENAYKFVDARNDYVKLIIGKNRNGETGIIDYHYNQKNQRFCETKE
jgi:replicative DNA helicase